MRSLHSLRSACFAALLLSVAGLIGCASKPPATQSGFLSDYSKLRSVDDSRMVYASPKLASYNKFIVDPVEVRIPMEKLSPEDRAEAARYFRESTEKSLIDQRLAVTEQAGLGVARVQMALTDIAGSKWWLKIHPVWRMAGAGTGGAAMEAQIIDSVTGEQLAAVVQSATGNQFNFTAFSTLADVKGAIDKWAESGAKELQEMRGKSAK